MASAPRASFCGTDEPDDIGAEDDGLALRYSIMRKEKGPHNSSGSLFEQPRRQHNSGERSDKLSDDEPQHARRGDARVGI